VRCAVDGSTVWIACVDDDVFVARVDVLPQPATWEPGLTGLAQALRPGTVVGDVRDSGWCAVLTESGLALPTAPLCGFAEVVPAATVEDDLAEGDDEALDPVVGTSPAPDVPPARLPVRVGASVPEIALGVAVALSAPVAALWLLGEPSGSWWEIAGLVVATVTATHWGLDLASRAVRIGRADVRQRSALGTRRFALRDVVDVRYSPGRIVLVLANDAPLGIGPFRDAVPGRHAKPSGGGRARRGARWWEQLLPSTVPSDGPTAASVAAAVDAAAAGARHGTDPRLEGVTGWRPGPGAVWLALVVTALAASVYSGLVA
jgi:hypothetical protein